MNPTRSRLVLLWMAGISLRLTVLAVPPLLPAIHRALHLDETAVGALTSLPIFLLAVAAVPGSLLVAKVGARRALLLGLSAISLFGAVRGIGSSTAILFVATLVMGCGIAVCQPALPSLVRSWLPARIGLGTASFSNGILVGEIVPVALTASVLAGWLGGWQPTLAIWSIPVVVTTVAVFVTTDNDRKDAGLPPARWWPDWRDGRVWLLGLTLGGASAAYWGANAFVPELLRHQHYAGYITAALTSLNLGQIVPSLLVALAANRLVARSWPLMLVGAGAVVTSLLIGFLPPVLLVADVGLLGMCAASVFVLALALPPLVAEAGDTHRVSAAMFTISYTCPFLGSLMSGALWDLTGVPQSAFATLVLGGAMMMLLPSRLDLTAARSRLHESDPRPEAVIAT